MNIKSVKGLNVCLRCIAKVVVHDEVHTNVYIFVDFKSVKLVTPHWFGATFLCFFVLFY